MTFTQTHTEIKYNWRTSPSDFQQYNNITHSCVRAFQSESAWFTIETGVRQWCELVQDSFITGHWLLERTGDTVTGMNGVSFGALIFRSVFCQ